MLNSYLGNMSNYKLLAFDMDGTLISELTWKKLHDYFGVDNSRNIRDYLEGRIDYEEFMRRDIELWKPRPHISEIKKVLLNYKLDPNASYVTNQLRNEGYVLSIISAGIDIVANDVAKRLEIPHVFANGLEIDEKGFLTGSGIFRVDLITKEEVLSRLADDLKISLDECIAVGDSKFDKSFLRKAGLGVALRPDEELVKDADVVIHDLKDLIALL